ncbi:MAG: ATP-binding cassette domain-containing protein [Clostridia bacterium]|nr:ATP-binding cassette domain-containing protein [Clostridia bacterium]
MIDVVHLTKKYESRLILNDIHVRFEAATIYGIVGTNGCGKTTLLRCICGFSSPTQGKVMISNKEIGKDIDFAPMMGVILETPGFIAQYSAKENLQILASYSGRKNINEIEQVIRKVGLNPSDKRPVGKYSLGMRQKLGIAQAIMDNPKYLLLDEPFNGLDPTGQSDMHVLLQEQKAKGTTVILVSHNVSDITQACDVIYEMHEGKLYSMQ